MWQLLHEFLHIIYVSPFISNTVELITCLLVLIDGQQLLAPDHEIELSFRFIVSFVKVITVHLDQSKDYLEIHVFAIEEDVGAFATSQGKVSVLKISRDWTSCFIRPSDIRVGSKLCKEFFPNSFDNILVRFTLFDSNAVLRKGKNSRSILKSWLW